MKAIRLVLAVLPFVAVLVAVGPAPASAAVGNCTRVEVRVNGPRHAGLPARGENVDCIVAPGHSGSPVRALQRHLNRCYRQGLDVDGVYGPRTADAVRHVQRVLDLTVDGVYGPQTSRKMFYAWYVNSNDRFAICANRNGYVD